MNLNCVEGGGAARAITEHADSLTTMQLDLTQKTDQTSFIEGLSISTKNTKVTKKNVLHHIRRF